MQLHQIKPIHIKKKRKKIGRGGKKGTYSGKGLKGQKSRAGHRFAPVIRELIKKHPKLKGYRSKILRKKLSVINLSVLNKNFKEGEIVNPKNLLERKLFRKMKGKTPKVKILAKGEIKKKLIIKDCELSESAKKAIEKAGGKVEISNF